MARFSQEHLDAINGEIARIEAEKLTPERVVILQLLKNMIAEDCLFWEKSFISPAVSAVTGHQYVGVNRWLLPGGEFITFKQLLAHNKKNGTNFRLPKINADDDVYTRHMKSSFIIMHYNTKPPRDLTDAERGVLATGGKPFGYVKYSDGSEKIVPPSSCSYFKVWSTVWIKDADTGESFPKTGVLEKETLFKGEQIIENYKKHSGVKIVYDSPGNCFYSPDSDTIHMAPYFHSDNFNAVLEDYNTRFHEMIHSTGIPSRLNRDSFAKWFGKSSAEYSLEELVAEIGACLLLSELDFDRNDVELIYKNSSAYISGWLKYLFSSKNGNKYGSGADKLLLAIRRAEKARNYIMAWFNEVPAET